MIKSGIAVVAVGVLVLFGYFYSTNSSQADKGDRAKQAVKDVGDAIRDKGVAELVEVRLKTKFGLDATRFIHAYFDEGRVVVYGMAPAEIDPEALKAEAAKVPGVNSVEVLIQPRPDYVASLKPVGGKAESPPETP